MQEIGLRRAIHALDSPDFDHSDFDLFSHVEHCLRGQSLKVADELLVVIDIVLRNLEKWILHATFLDWTQRLRKHIEISGDYFERS
jgi:hypothetical protein